MTVTAEASGTVTVLANLQLEVEAAIVWPVTPGPSTTSTVTKCQWHRQLELEQPQAERFKFQGSVPTYTPALGRLGPDANTVQQLLSSTTCSTQRRKQCRADTTVTAGALALYRRNLLAGWQSCVPTRAAAGLNTGTTSHRQSYYQN